MPFSGVSRMPKFQSTPSCGGRHQMILEMSRLQRVSIHALLRRATIKKIGRSTGFNCFNPRPPAEGDNPLAAALSNAASFNPRPPAEGDCHSMKSSGGRHRFQSTPSCGGRPPGHFCVWPTQTVSIHALLRRATSLPGVPC